jgi:3-phenylpropionate/trans-cinnamate dioxygenase ferredoxin subunit
MWKPVVPESELQNGAVICQTIEGKQLLLVRSAGELFSCGAVCPHQGVLMDNALVFDDEITCPEHSWVFSLRTGELTWPGSGPRIPTYPIRITDGVIEVEIEG